ncbi:uncharacterized protein LOC117718444 [Arvicanthis niloticus]|uniref:uncharacterized protein LOC117718444 n=1 Tax=Arvicanthis niloticus TaxID=61156 RepID=UPI00402BE45D
MDPLVKRALQGQDEEKLRVSMEPSTPRVPRVDIRVERMLAARVTSESRLDPPSQCHANGTGTGCDLLRLAPFTWRHTCEELPRGSLPEWFGSSNWRRSTVLHGCPALCLIFLTPPW